MHRFPFCMQLLDDNTYTTYLHIENTVSWERPIMLQWKPLEIAYLKLRGMISFCCFRQRKE